MLKIEIERQAAKVLTRLPTNVLDLIVGKVEQLAGDPRSLQNNVTKLVGTDHSRLRVGDWRVIFKITDNTLIVTKIAPRGSAYD